MHRGEYRVTTKAETGVMHALTKEHPGLPTATRSQERGTGQTPSEPPEGANPTTTSTANFCTLGL